MPKGYWIPHIDVSDPEGYRAYMAATPPAHEKYGGIALVRGGKMRSGRRPRPRRRNVLREFPDYATALACYRSRRISARAAAAPAAFAMRFHHRRGLRRRRSRRRFASRAADAACGDARAIGSAHIDVDRSRKATRPTWPPTWRRSANSAAAFWCAAARAKWSRAKSAPAPWCWNFRATTRRSPATARPNIRRRKSCATARRKVDLVIVEGYDGPKF